MQPRPVVATLALVLCAPVANAQRPVTLSLGGGASLPLGRFEEGASPGWHALASLGSPAAVAPLIARYALEDEDPRWYTLKALDYIGGDEAMKFVGTAGVNDDDNGPKRLAQRIMKK